MEELRVPTRQITVEVFTLDGAQVSGSLYVTEALHQTGGPEDVVDVLNDERAFVPFSSEDPAAGVCLLNKKHIVRIHLNDATKDDLRGDQEDAERAPACTLLFGDGSRLTGRLILATPVASSRLVDKFNQAPSFMLFVSDDGLDFVHGAHIVRVFGHD